VQGSEKNKPKKNQPAKEPHRGFKMKKVFIVFLALIAPSISLGFTQNWNASYESSPADGDNISQGAGKIRDFKEDIRERVDVDHYMDESGTQADHGQHRQINFQAPISTPTDAANKAFLYGKDVSGKIELHWLDEDGNEVQLTSAGALNQASEFVSGTSIGIFDNACPSGWTVDATNDDYQVVSETTESEGGSVSGSDSPTSGLTTTNGHALTIAELALHNHSVSFSQLTAAGLGAIAGTNAGGSTTSTNTGSKGSGDAHSHTITHAPKTIKMIICVKD
jgi:hypothetical protein